MTSGPSSDRGIAIAEDDPSLGPVIEAELLAALGEASPQAENTSFVLGARDSAGVLVGGVTGATSYGWLLVKTLWVAPDHRKHGLGRALMEAAEARARSVGCHGAWLDTSSADAMRFYGRLGYAAFGRLANEAGQHPGAHCRWFMSKML